MSNPYHDETGRFCSRGDMQNAIQRLVSAGNNQAALDLLADFKSIDNSNGNVKTFYASNGDSVDIESNRRFAQTPFKNVMFGIFEEKLTEAGFKTNFKSYNVVEVTVIIDTEFAEHRIVVSRDGENHIYPVEEESAIDVLRDVSLHVAKYGRR